MFKLVVLCAFIAAAGAELSVLHTPLAYSTSVLTPATTTITRQASSVVHPSPVLYSAPLGFTHFIKKRSAPLVLSSYIAPTSYISAAPLTTAYSAPFIHAAPIVPASPLAPIYTHLIKKRSAPLIYHSNYIAPTTYVSSAPLATTYSAPLVHAAPIVPAAPLASFYTHLIKKRSAPLVYSTHFAPTTYVAAAPLTTTYSAPLVHAAPIVPAAPLTSFYTHLIKKRSAPLVYSAHIAPTTYVAAAPLATTYSAPLVHAAPIVPAAPLAPIYTHLIKKRSAALAYHSTFLAPTTYAAATPFVASTYTATAPIYSTPVVSSPVTYAHFIKKRSTAV